MYNTPSDNGFISGYLGAKLLWNPNYDTDLAINEFLQGVYGDAATPMRLYIDLIHEAVSDPATVMGIWIGADAPFFSDALFARADALFNVAEEAVANEPKILERVRIARLPVDYCIMERTRSMSSDAFVLDHKKFTVSINREFEKRAKRFFDVAERNGMIRIRENGGELAEYKKEIYTFIKPRPHPPVEAPKTTEKLAPGIAYKFYGETLDHLPDFNKLTPIANGTAESISLQPAEPYNLNAFALLFEGYIDIPRDGMYAFTVASNDGQQLYIGDKRVVNNDGCTRSRQLRIHLLCEKGNIPIRCILF